MSLFSYYTSKYHNLKENTQKKAPFQKGLHHFLSSITLQSCYGSQGLRQTQEADFFQTQPLRELC